MPPDLDTYRPYVEGFDLTEAQKADLIHTLWSIMEAFADQAFGLHPAQHIPASPIADDPHEAAIGVDWGHMCVSDPFQQAAGPLRRRKDDTDHAGD